MKLKASSSGNDHEVVLAHADEPGAVASVAVDGRQYELDVRRRANGEYLLRDGSKVYNCRVNQKSAGVFEVVFHGRNYEITIIDPKRLRSGQTAGTHHSGSAEIVSPMHGKIVRILIKAGDRVDAGTGVIIVEAMKMQNEMKSPKAGTVVSIAVAEGATVNAGDVLAVIE